MSRERSWDRPQPKYPRAHAAWLRNDPILQRGNEHLVFEAPELAVFRSRLSPVALFEFDQSWREHDGGDGVEPHEVEFILFLRNATPQQYHDRVLLEERDGHRDRLARSCGLMDGAYLFNEHQGPAPDEALAEAAHLAHVIRYATELRDLILLHHTDPPAMPENTDD